jgi:iron(III) transport system ATP-binding protein
MIELAGVRKKFGPLALFEDLEFEVAGGETLVITGPSGCGKTTLLRMIAGLERPDGGEMRVNGTTVFHPRAWVAAHDRGVALSFQEPVLWPHMDLVENIRLGNPSVSRVEAAETLERLGLKAGGKVAVGSLSGGEARRVDLARAVLSGRPVLLLDEPMAHLDPELAGKVFDWLRSETRSRTRIIVTHTPGESREWGGEVRRLTARGLQPL